MKIGSKIFFVHVNYFYFLAVSLTCCSCYLSYKVGKKLGKKLGKYLLKVKRRNQRKIKKLRGGAEIHPYTEKYHCLEDVKNQPLEVIDGDSRYAVYDLFKTDLDSNLKFLRIDRITYIVSKTIIFCKNIRNKKKLKSAFGLIDKVLIIFKRPVFEWGVATIDLKNVLIDIIIVASGTEVGIRRESINILFSIIKFGIVLSTTILTATLLVLQLQLTDYYLGRFNLSEELPV